MCHRTAASLHAAAGATSARNAAVAYTHIAVATAASCTLITCTPISLDVQVH